MTDQDIGQGSVFDNKRTAMQQSVARLVGAAILAAALTSCGYSGIDGEGIGQAKKVTRVTNLFCEDYDAFDMSLGVMQNGTGSVSTQDIWFTVPDRTLIPKLRDLVARGVVVKVTYDTRRVPFCTEHLILRSVEAVPQ